LLLKTTGGLKVAVLFATYNGARFIAAQIKSLKENVTPFTLHWLDDHSSDNTRELVRAEVLDADISLCEWHQPLHQGVPAVFFQLLECVDADIYLFCDQDDIWQPGKIDSTVENLLPDISLPVLCFSDPFVFDGSASRKLRSLSTVLRIEICHPQESNLFMGTWVVGNTMGFTRALRELFLRHSDIARTYAAMHDYWMYILAHASGTVRMLSNVPTTLFRRHKHSWSGCSAAATGNHLSRMWRVQRQFRHRVARQATGFVIASATMPVTPKLERLQGLARMSSSLDRRQTPANLLRLARRGAVPFPLRFALAVAAASLCSDATDVSA
jgi:rhamnosyltransferase